MSRWLLVVICFVGVGLMNTPSFAKYERCGDPPILVQDKSKESSSIVTNLDGKASALSKLIGSAELGGQIRTDRETIYKNNPPAEAQRQEAYLAYVFCTLLEDSNADLTAKMKALQEFRKPLSSNDVPKATVVYLRDQVTAAVIRAREEAEKGRTKAAAFPQREVGRLLSKVVEVESKAYEGFLNKTNDGHSLHWGPLDGEKMECCGGWFYTGQLSNGRPNGYGKLDGPAFTMYASFTDGNPGGFGCRDDRADDFLVRICGTFPGDGTIGYPTGIVSFTVIMDGLVLQEALGDGNPNGYLEGNGIIRTLGDVPQIGDAPKIPSGTRFEGQLTADNKSGYYGIGYDPDGSFYEGQWVDDVFQGYGRRQEANGRVSEGIWSRGKLQGSLAKNEN